MQKEPKDAFRTQKSVYHALHNQMDHQLLGADKAIQRCTRDWTQRHQTSLIWSMVIKEWARKPALST